MEDRRDLEQVSSPISFNRAFDIRCTHLVSHAEIDSERERERQVDRHAYITSRARARARHHAHMNHTEAEGVRESDENVSE